jgi:hypothetical protein
MRTSAPANGNNPRAASFRALLSLALLALPLWTQAQPEWLAICSRCPTPFVFQKTGTGTANAVAEAKMTSQSFSQSCGAQGLQGAALKKCIADELAADGGKIYRATADCTAGKLMAIDGRPYTLAGLWPANEIGGGRTRWRNAATGQLVGSDNASGGLGLAQQWEVLCPGPAPRAAAPSPSANPAKPAAVPPAPVCGATPQCTEVNTFAAIVSDFRFSTSGNTRIVTATVRFQNKLARPLILGYLSGSGVAIDDRGNRFQMNESTGLRGMGLASPKRVDPKFLLMPGQSADARVEYRWYPAGGEIFGTAYDLEFAVREILPVSATQFRVGLEHPLKWRGLAPPESSAAPAPTPTAQLAAAPAPTAPIEPEVDHCQGLPRCYSAGPFIAQVQQVTDSRAGNNQVVGFKLRFRNVSTQPVVLAYKYGTALAIDNNGQRLTVARSNSVLGIGTSRRGVANADFVLQPGQSRDATFQLQRYVGRSLVGTGFTFDVAIEQLEVLPANQLRTLREFSLSFPDLTANNPAGQSLDDASKRLKDLFRRKK